MADNAPVIDYSTASDPLSGAQTGGGISNSFHAGVASASAGLNAIGAAMGSRGSLDAMRENERIAQNYQAFAAKAGTPQSIDDVHGPVDLLRYVGGQGAASVPMLGEMALGGVIGGPVGAAAATYPSVLGGNLEAQYHQSGKFNLPAAGLASIPAALLNAATPEGRLLSGAGLPAGATASRLANAGIGAVRGAASGGVAMEGQAALSNFSRMGVDPNASLDDAESMKGYREAVGGGIIGGVIGAGHSFIHAPAVADDTPKVDQNPSVPSDNRSPYDLLDRPAYERRGIAGPDGQRDMFGNVGDQQQRPGQGYVPQFDDKGNPVNNAQQLALYGSAQAGAHGPVAPESGLPGPGQPTQQGSLDLIDRYDNQGVAGPDGQRDLFGPDQNSPLHNDPQAAAQGPVAPDGQPGAGQPTRQRALDLSDAPYRKSTGQGTPLFGDQAGITAVDTATKQATQPQPPAQPGIVIAGAPPAPPANPPKIVLPGETEPITLDQLVARAQGANPANPNAKVVVPGQETPPRAQPLVTPQGPNAAEQLAAAQIAQRQGKLLTPDQVALLRNPPDVPAPPIAGAPAPFALTPPDTHVSIDPQDARPAFALEHPPGPSTPDPRQGTLPLTGGTTEPEARAAAPAPVDPRQGALPLAGEPSPAATNSAIPWQTRLRMAWKDTSNGNEQGFHKAAKDALAAPDAESAAAALRAKAESGTSQTAFPKLDAMHKALTGKSIEDAKTEAAAPKEDGQGYAASLRPEVKEALPEAAAEGGSAKAEPAPAAEKPKQTRASPAESKMDRSEFDKQTNLLESVKTSDPNAADKFQRAVDALHVLRDDTRDMKLKAEIDQYLKDPTNGITPEHMAAAQAHADLMSGKTEAAPAELKSVNKFESPEKGVPLPADLVKHGAPTDANTAAQSLAKNADSAQIRHIMGKVAAGVDLSHVQIFAHREGDQVHPAIAKGLDAAHGVTVIHGNGDVSIHVHDGGDQETLAHEILHAATLKRMDANPEHAAQIKSLMDAARTALEGKPEFDFLREKAMQDPKEFLAYGLSNPKLHDALTKMSDKGEPLTASKPSLWDHIRDTVRSWFGLPKMFKPTFDRLMDGGRATSMAEALEKSVGSLMEKGEGDHSTEQVAQRIAQMSRTPGGTLDAFKDAAKEIFGDLGNLKTKVNLAVAPTHAITDGYQHIMHSLPEVQHSLDDRTTRQHEMARDAAVVHDKLVQAYKEAGTLDRVESALRDAQITSVDPRDSAMQGMQSKLAAAKAELAKLPSDAKAQDQLRAKAKVENAEKALKAQEGFVSGARLQAYMKVAQEKLNALKPTSSNLERARAEDHMKQVAAQVRLRDTWNKMGKAERAAFDSAVSTLRDFIDRRQQALADMVLKNREDFRDAKLDALRGQLGKGDDAAVNKAIDEHLVKTYAGVNKIDGAYAPLKRFGNWAVTATSKAFRDEEQTLRDARAALAADPKDEKAAQQVKDSTELLNLWTKDGNHRLTTFHESEKEATGQLQRVKEQFKGTGHDVAMYTRENFDKHAPAVSASMMGKITDAVTSRLPEALQGNIRAVLRDMYIESLPEGNFAQTQAHRGLVEGYSMDFTRGTLDQLLRDSFQISTIENSDRMGAAMKALDEERKSLSTLKASHIYDTIAKRVDNSTDFKQFAKWEQRISEVTHVMYLGLSPSFLLMNFMQMPMITHPMLTARFGLSHSGAELARAALDIGKTIDLKSGKYDISAVPHLTADEKDMLTRLQNLGILNMTQLHEMVTAAHASNIIDPKTPDERGLKKWEQTKNFVNMPAQMVETVNRAGSALAAYRLAREGKSKFGAMDHGAAADYATKIVRDSHVDYSAQNNAAWMKTGNVAGMRLAFQFKKYWVNMLTMVSRNMYDSFGFHSEIKGLRSELADSKLDAATRTAKEAELSHYVERQAIARRTLAGLYGMHFLHTGALGMPFAGSGIALANIMRQWYADPEQKVDTESDIKNYLADSYGITVSELVTKGIWPALIGADLTRIGMGDLAAPVRVLNGDTKNATDYSKELLLGAMGPTVGLSLQMIQGMQLMGQGNFERGLEKMMPKAVGDILKGVRYGQEGVKSPTGKVVTQPEVSAKDAFLQAIGIAPTKVSEAYSAANTVLGAKQQFTQARKELISQMADAQNDPAKLADVQARVNAFNERNTERGARITMSDVLKAKNAKPGAKPPKTPTALQQRFNREGRFAQEQQ